MRDQGDPFRGAAHGAAPAPASGGREPVLDYRPILFICGLLMTTLAVAMLLGCVLAARQERWGVAVAAAALVLLTREAYAVALIPVLWRGGVHRLVLAAVPYAGWLAWVRVPGLLRPDVVRSLNADPLAGHFT